MSSDTVQNPVARAKSADVKVDTVLASFEDESKAVKKVVSSDAFETEDGGAMFSGKSQYADHGAGNQVKTGKVGCCVKMFMGNRTAANVADHSQLTDSVIEFDPIMLAADQEVHPSLVDSTGFELSLDPNVDIDHDEIPEVDEEIKAEDIGHLALLEIELQRVHDEIHDLFDPRNPEGNSLKNQEVHKLHKEAEAIEKRMDLEQKRLKQEEEEEHARAVAAGAAAKAARSDSGKAAMARFQKAGRKALMGVHAVNAVATTVNHVTIDDPHLSLGMDWHFQNSKAVCASVRDGGSAQKYLNGKVLRPGMVLKSFSLGRDEIDVTYSYIKKEMAKYPPGFVITPGHCLAVILDHSRPMVLHFEEPGFDLTEDDKAAGMKASKESQELGFALQDLRYLVPKTVTKLGAKFWKTRHGVALCDIEDDSIMSTDEFLLEGVRPGLLLKKIISADGFTRNMVSSDLTYTQIMRQVAISQRPCVYVFDARAEPLEFTFDGSVGMGKPTKRDKKLIKARTTNAHTKQPYVFSIFRHLGLCLREEEVGGEGTHNWRVRISGILPGGLIDRFNRTHQHAWVTPGMTIATLYSPMYHVTDVRGMNLAQIVDVFHKCAPGKSVTKTGKDMGGKMREFTLDGQSITIGFEVTLRALQQREIVALAHGGHRGETETAKVDLGDYEKQEKAKQAAAAGPL